MRIYLLLLLPLTACNAVRQPLPASSLIPAEAFFENEQPDLALDFLLDYDREEFDRIGRERYDFLRGQVMFALERYPAAADSFSDFLQSQLVPAADKRNLAIERLFAIGVGYLEGVHREFFGIFPDRTRGARFLRSIGVWAPDHPRATYALILAADFFYDEERWAEAADEYQRIYEEFRPGEWTAKALFRHAACRMEMVPSHRLDRSWLLGTRAELELYLKWTDKEGVHATEAMERITTTNRMLAQGDYDRGQYYAKIGSPLGAALYYTRCVVEQPGTASAELAIAELSRLPAEQRQQAAELVPTGFPEDPPTR